MTAAKAIHMVKAVAAAQVDLIVAFFPGAWYPSYKRDVDAMPLGVAVVINVLCLAVAGLVAFAAVSYMS